MTQENVINKKRKQKKPSIWSYVGRFKGAVTVYIILSILICGLDIFMTLLGAQMLVELTEGSFQSAIQYLCLNLIVLIVDYALSYLSNWVYAKYTNKITAEMNYDIARQAFKLNSKSYADHDTGSFVQRIVSDPSRIVESLANLVDIIIAVFEQFVIFIYLSTLNIWIALALLAILLIGSLINWGRAIIRRKTRKEMFKATDKVNSLTTEIVRSEKDIKSLGLEEKLSETSRENFVELTNKRFKVSLVNMSSSFALDLFMAIGKTLLLILGLYLTDKAIITLASFMILFSYRGQAFNFVYYVGSIINTFADISVSHKRIFALFDEDEFVTEKFGNLDVSIEGGAEVEFDNVSFSYKEYKYPESKNDEKKSWRQKRAEKKERKKNPPQKELVSENKVLENLSFKIEKNTTVAFVGKSGSGKSTILDLISKMYEVDDGKVLINGANVNDLSKGSLRNNISLVNQFPYIFDMTIKENLLLANPKATDEDIEEALKKSSLDEFIATLPNGVETKVGESGIKLSGGQKQRLAIARAMLRKSSIIIFDESTSSLDNFAQNNVKQSIDNLKGTSTIVIVAHRLSTIKNVDHIFFLDKGKIVDEGTFDELFERNEMFKTMFMAENI